MLEGDSVRCTAGKGGWLQKRTVRPAVHTPGAASPCTQHSEGLQHQGVGRAAKRSPWLLLCKPDISVSQLKGLKVRKGMGHYLISFPDFLLLFWAIYTFKNA